MGVSELALGSTWPPRLRNMLSGVTAPPPSLAPVAPWTSSPCVNAAPNTWPQGQQDTGSTRPIMFGDDSPGLVLPMLCAGSAGSIQDEGLHPRKVTPSVFLSCDFPPYKRESCLRQSVSRQSRPQPREATPQLVTDHVLPPLPILLTRPGTALEPRCGPWNLHKQRHFPSKGAWLSLEQELGHVKDLPPRHSRR